MYKRQPLIPRIKKWLYESIIGAKIDISTNSSFASFKTLFEFKDTLNYCNYRLQFKTPIKYSYLRYSVPVGKPIELGDIGAVSYTHLCIITIMKCFLLLLIISSSSLISSFFMDSFVFTKWISCLLYTS